MLAERTKQQGRQSVSPISRVNPNETYFTTPQKGMEGAQEVSISPHSNNENMFTPNCKTIYYEQKIANQSTQAQLQSPFCGSPNLNWQTPQSMLKTKPFLGFSEHSTPNDNHVHTPISPYADRYIPLRQEIVSRNLFQVSSQQMILPFDTSETHSNLSNSIYQTMDDEEKQQKNKLYQSLLQETLLDIKIEQQHEGDQVQSVLSFKNKINDCENQKYLSSSKKPASFTKPRKIDQTPFKVLDAPGLQDDFYQDVLHWGKSNLIAVGLSQAIYLYNYSNGKVMRVTEQRHGDSNYYTSLQWNPSSSMLAIGTIDGTMTLWDAGRQRDLSKTVVSQKRIATISWANNNVFACGSKDRSILVGDIRVPNLVVTRWSNAHQQEVCGVTFSDNETQLASGGNDNKVHIWALNGGLQSSTTRDQNDYNKNYLQWTMREHKAAVRALAWNPHVSGVLATGGGSADKTIKISSTLNNTILNNIEVDSQVCKIKFSRNTNEFVSTHGYEKNQVMIWQYSRPKRLSCLEGHSSRVLYMSFSPDDSVLVTGSGDETLKFWNVFPKPSNQIQSEVLKISDFR